MSLQEWSQMELDKRLVKALKDKYDKPTLIQNTCIPLGLEGKSLGIKASTGSGKSLCFLVPIISRLLTSEEKALILLPTRELAFQVHQLCQELLKYVILEDKISILNSLEQDSREFRILIATPTRFLALNMSREILNQIQIIVLDEVDLLKSFGYEEEVKEIMASLKSQKQVFSCSATLHGDFKGVLVELKEEESRITQFVLKVQELEKYLILMVLLKLRISPIGNGKILLFTNSKEKCYRIKLFLEQFGIKAATLNSDLPVDSRFHIVQEFNRGIYDFLIATDESLEKEELKSVLPKSGNSEKETVVEKPFQKKIKRGSDPEYGVCRGIDFKNVKSVINFDLPKSSKSYLHRIGRTGRGDNKGYALSFYTPGANVAGKKELKISQDKVFSKIEKVQKESGTTIEEFKFDMTQVQGFRYRVEDALRAVTGSNVRDAHLKDIKHEILNSEKLKSHFENRPKDLEALRHDKLVCPSRIQHQLKHIPDYLLPKRMTASDYTGYVPFSNSKKKRKSADFKKKSFKKARKDPLKNF